MRGNEKVIEQLNAALSAELTAIAQYMVQAEMCEAGAITGWPDSPRRGPSKKCTMPKNSIERIIFLGGTPAINVPLMPKVGATVEQQQQYATEPSNKQQQKKAIAASRPPAFVGHDGKGYGFFRRRRQAEFIGESQAQSEGLNFVGQHVDEC